MNFLILRGTLVLAATALAVWFVPGVDDAVESVFQILVLIVSS